MEQKNDLMRWKDKIAVKKETDLAILQISVRAAEKL